jgi:ATP-binding cassette subfamily B protein
MWTGWRRALAFVIPYWRKLVLVLAVSLLSTVLALAQPYLSKFLIDEALIRRDANALLVVAGLMVAAGLLGSALGILSSYRYVKVSAAVLFDMRLRLFRHLQTLSPRYYARTKVGDIVSRLNNDIAEIQRVSADGLLGVFGSALFLAGSAGAMIWLDWRLFLISASVVPVNLMLVRYFQDRLTSRVRYVRERSADIGSFLIENLLGMRLVVASAAEQREAERFRFHNSRFVDAMLSMQFMSYLASSTPAAVVTLSTAVVFLYGGHRVIAGELSVGSLVAILAYHLRLLAPIQGLLGIYANAASARASLERVFEVLDTPAEVVDHADAQPLESCRGDVEFRGVTLRHDRDANVLHEVSFHVPARTTCAIVGRSGIGKSTVGDLLLRFYDPDAGSVAIDGVDIRKVRLSDLRRHIALVEQTPVLFHASIAENIAYGRPGASRDEIAAAARSARIDEFIRSVPHGYDTLVGERGQALSAGERQRIALARALLRNPAILILDEPTSALDAGTESGIAAALAELPAKTIIVITHRPALAEIADQIVTLDRGDAADVAVSVAQSA